MDILPISKSTLSIESDLQKSYFQACRIEEEFWHQKSRNLWIESGDKNTNYFHKQAEARKSFKAVTEINFRGSLIKDSEEIKKAAFLTFKDLFYALDEDPLNPLDHPFDLIPPLIQEVDNLLLTAPISLKELKIALFRMKPDSAPSPDGFTARFYTSC